MRCALALLSALVVTTGCNLVSVESKVVQANQAGQPVPPPPKPPAGAKLDTLVVGGGCFWCIEVKFEELKGVYNVESGYAGGNKPNLTYEEIGTGKTGAAEVIKVTYNPAEISRDDLLRIFFVVHDPTQLNRQGPDVGPQYRSVVFYRDAADRALAQKIRDEIAGEKIWDKPIVTTFEPLKNYSRAEDYHQDYFARFERAGETERMKMNAGYCAVIIAPKVREFRQKFRDKIRGS